MEFKPEIFLQPMLEGRIRAEWSLSAAAKMLEMPVCMGPELLHLQRGQV